MNNSNIAVINAVIAIVLGFTAVLIGNPVRPIHYVLGTTAFVFALLGVFFHYKSQDTNYGKLFAILIPLVSIIVLTIRHLAGR
ncbi:MAG: hypothetical protein CVU89_00360 [Firmicutes bacterium HGW-Firmicutes-14]|nr:MAG: hypothetical protein CVU89_00360 [Firmicutes bacterium HGW-Firmicutes-14]